MVDQADSPASNEVDRRTTNDGRSGRAGVPGAEVRRRGVILWSHGRRPRTRSPATLKGQREF